MEILLKFFIVVLLLFGGIVLFLWGRKIKALEKELTRLRRETEKEREMFGGLGEFNKKIAEAKEQRKQKIMDEITSRGNIRAGRVADLLEVSEVTAFRYLDELEKEGKIKQMGSFGRGVEYTLKHKI